MKATDTRNLKEMCDAIPGNMRFREIYRLQGKGVWIHPSYTQTGQGSVDPPQLPTNRARECGSTPATHKQGKGVWIHPSYPQTGQGSVTTSISSSGDMAPIQIDVFGQTNQLCTYTSRILLVLILPAMAMLPYQ